MERIGKIGFWKVSIKPGKPFAFGKLNNAIFFGLPGNPVSSVVTFKLLVVPALKKMGGYFTNFILGKSTAKTTLEITKRTGRTEFQRGQLERKNGELFVTPLSGQGSHQLYALAQADCLIRLNAEITTVTAGEQVDIVLL